MTYKFKSMKTPLGVLKLVASARGLVAILWENDDPARVRLLPVDQDDDDAILSGAAEQLAEYFAGARQIFSVKLDLVGTEFQVAVWNGLLTIPFGETRSYGDLARQIGHPKAVRAVGAANGRNPISIVVPCHRVIGSNGTLTGFAGGLEAKQFLLNHESKQKTLDLGIAASMRTGSSVGKPIHRRA